HESCGAIRGAIDGVERGNITAMLANIKPAVEHFKDYEGEQTGQNPEFVKMVTKQNVLATIDRIRTNSPILKEMEQQGDIKIVGGIYNMDTGTVTMLEE
ncbi:MAG: carbonic anhydrase, partial [Gimesia chilikensis]